MAIQRASFYFSSKWAVRKALIPFKTGTIVHRGHKFPPLVCFWAWHTLNGYCQRQTTKKNIGISCTQFRPLISWPQLISKYKWSLVLSRYFKPFMLKSLPNRKGRGQRPERPIILIRYLKAVEHWKNRAKIWIDQIIQMYRTFWIITSTLSIRWDFTKVILETI